ncbi:hypothetical protein [Vulcanisaeta sp. JCM 14467]|nr:hypothetical protein [Vulcanisaeta sp. JCM 14467]
MAIIRRLLRIIEEREALLDRYSPDELIDVKALLSHAPTPDAGPA